MDQDDVLVGRLLSRREAVKLIGLGSAVFLPEWTVAAGQPSAAKAPCVVRPELTEGPYFVDGALARPDIRTDTVSRATRDGVALALGFNLLQVASGQCSPLPQAVVHVWQCDAVGIYSGVNDPQVGSRYLNDNALRGVQTTDSQGRARFTTVYPGWYRGRAVHIHFKIRTQASGPAFEYTSQLFFPETLNDEVHAKPPYAAKGRRDTMNDRDGIYRQGGGEQLLLQPARSPAGYDAAIDIALDLSDASVGKPDGGGMRGRGRGPGRGGERGR